MVKINLKFFLAMILLTFGVGNAKTLSQTTKYQYPAGVIAEYVKSCQERSLKEGLAQQDRDKLCGCTITEFQNLYPLEEFNKLREEAKNNQEAADQLSEVGFTCLDQILYENPPK